MHGDGPTQIYNTGTGQLRINREHPTPKRKGPGNKMFSVDPTVVHYTKHANCYIYNVSHAVV